MSGALWNVELHSHTYWSKDCLVRFEDILQVCEARGIDKIAITDHNTAESALALQKIAPTRVIVGEEIFTTQGELLGYYMQETIPPGLTPQETIKRLREQGAVISVSHPFDKLRKGAWKTEDLRAIIDQVDAIEIFNSRCLIPQDNQEARTFAKLHGVLGTAGSDAHTLGEYGRGMLQMPPFDSAETFKQALANATPLETYSPFYVHFGSIFAKWSRKLGIVPRPPR